MNFCVKSASACNRNLIQQRQGEVMAKVSVIIPVYNAEKYFKECLESVINQTLLDLEIIVIDDGSTDTSGQIADEYAKCDKRINVIHKKNGGLISARKRGVEEATSEYIGFVDADDWIEPDMYEDMYLKMQQYKADMIQTEIFHYMISGEYVMVSPIEEGVYQYEDIVRKIFPKLTCGSGSIHASMGIKLFRSDMLKTIIATADSRVTVAEDVLLSYQYIIKCKRIVVLNKAYYHYRMNAESMCHKQDYNILTKTEIVINTLRECYQRHENSDLLLKTLDKAIYSLLLFDYKLIASKSLEYFYLFPYEKVEYGSNIILYGAGNVGKAYFEQLKRNNYCEVVLWVDSNFRKYQNGKIYSPKAIIQTEYDYIVVAVSNKNVAMDIIEELINYYAVARQNIVWTIPINGMDILF